MRQVRCINAAQLTQVREGEVYYVTGETNTTYYISRFEKPGSHMGQFQKSRFEVIKVEKPKTDLLRIHVSVFGEIFEGYGFLSKNNLLAIFTAQNLKTLVAAVPVESALYTEVIGKTDLIYIMPTPLMRERALLLTQLEGTEEEQLTLF